MKNPRIKFDWMQSRSDAARQGWEGRWDRGTAPIGPKGEEYLKEKEERGGGGEPEEYDYEGPVWEEEYEWDY